MPRQRLLDVLWVSILIFYILMGVPLVPFHGDESTLIYTTRDYAYQFIDRDVSMLMYNGNPAINPMDQDLRILDGRVHKYLGGFFWHLAGYSADDLNTPWDWGGDWNYNIAAGHMPSEPILMLTRFASAVLMAAGVVAIFGVGMRVDGRITAYVASALYALNPALLLNGRRSMMEGSLMGFSMLTVLAALFLLTSQRHQAERGLVGEPTIRPYGLRLLFKALLLGLAAGLALSSKLTGVLVVGIVFGAVGLYALLCRDKRTLPLIGSLALASIVALLVFYAFNPLWWGDPIARAGLVAETRLNFIQNQIGFFDEYPTFRDQVAGFARQVIGGEPQFYEIAVWQEYIGDQISTYMSSIWAGFSLPVVLTLVLYAFGIWRLLRGEQRKQAERFVVGVWIVGITLALIVATPFEWQRYYLPVIPALCVLAGLGAEALWRGLRDRSKANQAQERHQQPAYEERLRRAESLED
jgi:4-amino-4-deoxy-L-arabinose transferase-like glycosyltransferase